jgi:hypothetical protein
MSQGTFDPSKRRLCTDGACIGVIGDDGRCRECGRSSSGAGATSSGGRAAAALDDAGGWDDDHDDDHAADDQVDDVIAGVHAQGAGAGTGGFRPDRPLCDDGSCVGVIGSDRRCSVCGRAGGG